MSDGEVRTPRPRRKNGITPPFTTAQMSTWFALPALVVEFLVVVSPILSIEVSIPCTIVFFITACSSAYNGLLAMSIDPADPRLPTQEEREKGEHAGDNDDEEGNVNQQNGSSNGGTRNWDPNEATKHCWICRHDVSEKSMHCKFCNKCVHTFDHHCMCKFLLSNHRDKFMHRMSEFVSLRIKSCRMSSYNSSSAVEFFFYNHFSSLNLSNYN